MEIISMDHVNALVALAGALGLVAFAIYVVERVIMGFRARRQAGRL